MNSEDQIYNKIKNASQKGEKDFPGMDKVWNRVEEKLDNTIVVQKKNTWQKLAIAATFLLTFSILYQLISNEETFKGKIRTNEKQPVIVSKDSVKKIIDQANEVVVENDKPKKQRNLIENQILDESFNPESDDANFKFYPSEFDTLPTGKLIPKKRYTFNYDFGAKEKETVVEEINKGLVSENEISMRNSASNYVSTNTYNGYLASNKNYQTTISGNNYKSKSSTTEIPKIESKKSEDIVMINGEISDKEELKELKSDDIEDVTYFPNPLYIINGIEYSEESLFGKKPTCPYAPLAKQQITSFNSIKPAEALKIYGKKGEKGVIIITTKNGKPADK